MDRTIKVKNKEKEILFTVYKQQLVEPGLIEDETPDFIITDPINHEKLGVEITTVYSGSASAITRNDKFLDEFIDRNKVGGKKKKNPPEYLNKLKVSKV